MMWVYVVDYLHIWCGYILWTTYVYDVDYLIIWCGLPNYMVWTIYCGLPHIWCGLYTVDYHTYDVDYILWTTTYMMWTIYCGLPHIYMMWTIYREWPVVLNITDRYHLIFSSNTGKKMKCRRNKNKKYGTSNYIYFSGLRLHPVFRCEPEWDFIVS